MFTEEFLHKRCVDGLVEWGLIGYVRASFKNGQGGIYEHDVTTFSTCPTSIHTSLLSVLKAMSKGRTKELVRDADATAKPEEWKTFCTAPEKTSTTTAEELSHRLLTTNHSKVFTESMRMMAARFLSFGLAEEFMLVLAQVHVKENKAGKGACDLLLTAVVPLHEKTHASWSGEQFTPTTVQLVPKTAKRSAFIYPALRYFDSRIDCIDEVASFAMFGTDDAWCKSLGVEWIPPLSEASQKLHGILSSIYEMLPTSYAIQLYNMAVVQKRVLVDARWIADHMRHIVLSGQDTDTIMAEAWTDAFKETTHLPVEALRGQGHKPATVKIHSGQFHAVVPIDYLHNMTVGPTGNHYGLTITFKESPTVTMNGRDINLSNTDTSAATNANDKLILAEVH